MSEKKILVVEDNPVNMELVTDLLEVAGFDFISAMTAEEGIRLAEKELPDLILMDIQLPGMDGLEATQLLKQNPKTRHITIVALTAHAMKGDEERALAVGCIGYITKPINTRTFPNLVKEFAESALEAPMLLDEPLVVAEQEQHAPATLWVTDEAPLMMEAESDESFLALSTENSTPVVLELVSMVEVEGAALEPILLDFEELEQSSIPPLELVSEDSVPVLELVQTPEPTPAPLTAPAEVEAPRSTAPLPDKRRKRGLNFATATNNPTKLLVVDDDEINREMLSAMLRTLGYDSELVSSGPEALEKLNASYDMVLLDYMMPTMDGVEVCKRIREESRFNDIPIVMVTALSSKEDRLRAVEAGANDWICKPVDRTELQVRVASLLKMKRAQDELKKHQKSLEETVRSRTADLRSAMEEVKESQEAARRAALDAMQRMAYTAEFREGPTAAAHIRAVGQYSSVLARAMGLNDDAAELLLYASQVHDIGLLAIEDSIVNKKGERDEYEESVYRQHAILGARLLSGSPSELLRAAELIALSHHERWDGRGYPQALEGDEIPLYGRIVALADHFDQWTSYNHKKRALTNEEAKKRLKEESGKTFDPTIVEAALKNFDELVEWQRRFRRAEEPPDDLPVSAISYAV
ncbi:response regulator [Armatimonas sp.]|uniref:response regulator n=1 Tax=Armatimonas sp. TaxID=1872638 RepID=UPI00286C27AA|nr:response regulator [Armatimonas sp.]